MYKGYDLVSVMRSALRESVKLALVAQLTLPRTEDTFQLLPSTPAHVAVLRHHFHHLPVYALHFQVSETHALVQTLKFHAKLIK